MFLFLFVVVVSAPFLSLPVNSILFGISYILILFTQLLYSFHKITNNIKTGQATAIIHTYEVNIHVHIYACI